MLTSDFFAAGFSSVKNERKPKLTHPKCFERNKYANIAPYAVSAVLCEQSHTAQLGAVSLNTAQKNPLFHPCKIQ